ncbi:MAG: relaxase domain-containing protein [Chthoniobacterales bacterium]
MPRPSFRAHCGVEKLIHEALRETLDDMEASVQTRVRVDDAEEDRSTGNAVFACFVHRTTRPVSGKVDPHWHCHALLMNATYDGVENRWKAAQLGDVIASKGLYQAAFHSRLAQKLMAAGHRLRRSARDFEMDVFTEPEVRLFCKRTKQIEELEKRPSASLVRARYMLTDLGTENVKSTQTRRLGICSWTGTLVWVAWSSFQTIRVRVVLFLAVSRFPEPGVWLLTMATKSSFLTSGAKPRIRAPVPYQRPFSAK